VGSLAALPLWLLMSQWPLWQYSLMLVLAFALGVWAAGKTGQAVGETDHGGIVWDEFVGLWITLAVVPREWPWVLAGFVAFRVFDILKPPPVRQLERRIPGGLGVMLDDVAAGLYALAVLLLARYLIGLY
jgi:phosphatidylglycerophosphatase A